MKLDITKLETLSRIRLTPVQRVMFEEQIPKILEYVGKLQEVDVPPAGHNVYLNDLQNIVSQDVVQVVPAQQAAVKSAFPLTTAGALEVPAVFE